MGVSAKTTGTALKAHRRFLLWLIPTDLDKGRFLGVGFFCRRAFPMPTATADLNEFVEI